MIEFLFLDLDDTILDFHKAEKIALKKTLEAFAIVPTEAVCDLYHRINKAHWEMLERGQITRDQVQVGRYDALVKELHVEADPAEMNRAYMANLSIGHYFLPGALEAVQALSQKYRLFLASNGTASVQAGRLKSANISRYFEAVFISQDLGANKPDPAFFERAFAQISGFDKSRAMIVGDSLTSDMLGGIQAGIATCWVAAPGIPAGQGITPDYRIASLTELESLLERL